MPREPDLTPKFYASRDRWALDIAGQFARDGKRRKEFFRTEQEAKTRALEIKNSLDQRGKVHRDATPELIRTAVHFHELFQFYGFSGLEEACEYLDSRLSEERRSPTLRSLVEAYLLDYKKASTAGDWKWLEGKLQAGLWDQRVATMDADFWRDELDATARRHKWAPRTYNLALMWLKSLFRHACANGKVPRNPVDAIRSMDLPARHVAVFEPEQLRELLANCFRRGHPEMALHFAVLCFAGLRPEAEFVREAGVRWEDVLWSQGLLRVRDTKTGAKTGALNRYVTLNPTLLSWLEAFRKDTGRICPGTDQQIRDRRAKVSTREDGTAIVKWGGENLDISRHSFGSYLAAVSTADEVRAEMGHTTMKTFFRHYRNARTPEQAREYWRLHFRQPTQLQE